MDQVLNRMRTFVLGFHPRPCEVGIFMYFTPITCALTVVFIFGYDTCNYGVGKLDDWQAFALFCLVAGWMLFLLYILVTVHDIVGGFFYRIQELVGRYVYPQQASDVKREFVHYVVLAVVYALIALAMNGRFNSFHTTLWWVDVAFSDALSILLFFPPLGTAFIAATTYIVHRKQ